MRRHRPSSIREPTLLPTRCALAVFLSLLRVETTRVLRLATLVQAASAFAFGTIRLIPSTPAFGAVAVVLRLLQGAALTFVEVTLEILVFRVVPLEKLGHALGILAGGRTAAQAIGPLLGGAFYELGGYPLPFFVWGTCFFACGAVSFILCPEADVAPDEKPKPVWLMVRIPKRAPRRILRTCAQR